MAPPEETLPRWYKPIPGARLTPRMRRVFTEYSGIPADSVEEHVRQVRERAWQLYQYPCIGQFQFLYTHTPDLPYYPDILACLLQGGTVLDLGCCFAQDLRILATDGVPTQNMYASDIIGDFWDLGLDLFRDEGKMRATFLQADIFDPQGALSQLEEKIDVVLATHFFHLFDRDMQIQAIETIIRLLRPGGRIVGFNIGRTEPELVMPENARGSKQANSKFYHNEESFRALWAEVGQRTATSWAVDVSISPLEAFGMPKEDFSWMSRNARALSFSVKMQSSKL